MATVLLSRAESRVPAIESWVPLVVLPAAAMSLSGALAPWVLMCTIALSVYAGVKWLTFADCPAAWRAPWWRRVGYLALWPGLDAKTFFADSAKVNQGNLIEWGESLVAIGKGCALIFVAVPAAVARDPLVAGWIGFAGFLLVLHFGIFHMLSLGWRSLGVAAPPIMHAPVRASSVSEFWGRRWNLAFRDAAYAYVFRPLSRRIGIAGATLTTFLASGVVHDLVITVPARGGWGGPTLYFLVQGLALLFERSRVGKRIGLTGGRRGRIYCAATVILPVGLLFPAPFIQRVILPMLTAVGAV